MGVIFKALIPPAHALLICLERGLVEEIWAPIDDFPDYAVSNYGQVRNIRLDHILKPRYNSYGYARVMLRRDGLSYDCLVHRLVAEAFITGYHEAAQVRHYDEDNGNNFVNNLRFRRGVRMGQYRKEHPPVETRRVRVAETNQIFRTAGDAAEALGTDPSSIYKVLRGERRSHLGYTFEYYYG